MGGDRVAGLNRLTAGLTTRFIDKSSGDERARFEIAQEYYFTTPQVTLIPGESIDDVRGADVIAGASLKIGAGFSTDQAVQYDEQLNRFDRTTSGFVWKPSDRHVSSLAYRYTRADEDLDNGPETRSSPRRSGRSRNGFTVSGKRTSTWLRIISLRVCSAFNTTRIAGH